MKTTIVFLSVVLSSVILLAQQPRNSDAWFRQLDRNGDGKLSREEVEWFPRLKAVYEYFDTNRDGGISQEEMKSANARWRQRQTEPEEPPATNTPPKRVTASVPKKPSSKPPAAIDANSPQFRGPRGDGVAYGTNLPVTWSTTSNVVWSCTIPGKGWSSPIVWGDRVFVTSALGPGSIEPPKELGSVSEHIRGQTTADEHHYMLHCVDWQTGNLLWSRCAHKGVPPGSIHPKNTYASETPVTDGERVYAYFGNIGLFCYDLDGRELWSRKWGSFEMGWNWGPAASPALHGDLLFVLNDNQGESFLVALDKRTGQDVWRVDRDEKSNWTTPFIWQNDLRTEIVTSGSGKVRSYDLTGKLLWELRGMSGVTVPTPFAADGLLYIASGCQHSSQRPVYAIRPGATGDISLEGDATSNAHIPWTQRRAAPYVTSPLVCDGLLCILLDKGFLAAYDARTGEEVYGKQRFTTGKAAFTASPWAYDGKIFCLTEAGETCVVEAGPEFRVLHVNRLDEAALATPAIARDSLILRTLTKLYRIANTSPTPLESQTKREPNTPASRAQQDFAPDAPVVGEVNGSYIDPEFSEAAGQVVFQDVKNNVWIGDLDPATGLFKTATGRDYLMDENITLIFDRPPQGRKFSTNGPEWTRDEKGHCVVYTKADSDGTMQQWMARLVNGKSVVTQLTRNKLDSYGNMPSRFQDGKPPRIAYTYDWPIWKAKAAWIFADKPGEPHNLDGFDYRQMSMWSAVSPDFLFVKRTPGAPHGQIARANADTGQVTMLTNDEGQKDDPGLFVAPEFGGEILLVCNVDNRALGIYRDEKRDGKSPWTHIATLTLPPDAPHKFISSPETIASATGVGGVSYFSLLAREGKDRNTPGSIWVLGLGKDPANRFVRRVDHGAATGAPTVVLEPEPFVGRNEVFVYYNFFDRANGQHGLRRAATGIQVAAAPTTATPASKMAAPRNESAATPLARLVFTQDYFPGTKDANGQFMGGTEAMWLAGHEGRLFAAIGYGQDQPGNDPKPGAQVLRKDAPDAPWQVDHGFEPNCMRVEGLISFAFTTDLHGKPLPRPARRLIASPSELTRAGGTSAVFVRDDATARWQRSDIAGGNLGVRSFGSHVDKATGVHHLFAGLNRGGIHRGSYDPAAPGGIRWETTPERTAEALPGKGRRVYDYSRVLCFAECNGDLYMASRITTGEDGKPVDGGLYRRVDGPQPKWELVHRWAIDKDVLQSRFLRGLTTVPDPKGGKHEVLIANFEYPGTIARFDPTRPNVTAEQELDIKEFFNQAWNTPAARRRGAIAAYNRFLPVTDPKSGETVWLCGAWVERPGSPNPPDNGSCYLIRHRDGRYDWGYIYDPAHPVPAGQKLTGCRDIEPSPFAGEQGRVFYFCGYDGGAGPSHNTAWIYKGTLKEKP